MRNLNTLRLIPSIFTLTFHEGEGTNGGSIDLPVGTALNPTTKKPWTQTELEAEINRHKAEEKRTWQEKNKNLITELETLKNKSGTSEEDKASLQKQIDDLNSTLQTKDEQQKTALGNLQDKYDKDTKKISSDRDTWKSRFENELFNNEIARYAEKHGAIRSNQITALLSPNKKFVEEIGSDGKPNGVIVPKVAFTKADKDGKKVTLDLTVEETIKAMLEMPDEFGNLFKSTVKAGFGSGTESNGGASTFSEEDVTNMSPEQYEKHRSQILAAARPKGE